MARKLDSFRKVSYVFFGVGVAFLIAGIVMLIIGIINANKTPDCPATTQSPSNGASCTGDNLNIFMISAYTSSINWDASLNDATSLTYNNTVTNLTNLITTAFSSSGTKAQERFLVMAAAQFTLGKVTISNIWQPPMMSGINFYSTLAFVGQNQPSPQNIADVLSSNNINAAVYTSSDRGQCLGYPSPPYPTSTSPTGSPPTGPMQTTTTPPPITGSTTACPPPPTAAPRPPYTNCDPTFSKTSVVFLVDAAIPTEPGITSDIKKTQIANYLGSFVPSGADNNWMGLQMGVAIYYGNFAYMVGNYLCSNTACWTDTLSRLNIQTGASSNNAFASHNVSAGLLFTINEFSQMFGGNDPYGTARLAIIVTDGYEYNGGADPAPGLATTLKNAGFKLTAVVATPSISVQNSFKPLVSISWSDEFSLPSLTQLGDPTLLKYTANWVCAAQPFTTPMPPTSTTTYTLPQLTTSVPSIPPSTTSGTTLPPTTTPGPCHSMDLLFLVDESQSMLLKNGFGNTKSFMKSVVEVYKVISDARFAWVAFNSKVWVQTPFLSAQDFEANVDSTEYNEGDTNFILGFNAAKATIATNSSRSRYPVLIFISDGYPNDGGDIGQIAALTKSLRCDLKTIIIALGINESPEGAANVQTAVGVGAQDGCVQSFYANISDYNNITQDGLPQIEQDLHCFQQPTTPPPSSPMPCNLDVIFLFENSELVDYNGRLLEIGAMVELLADYESNGTFSFYGDRIGIVFFSSVDGFNGAEFNRSGVLVDPANNNNGSYTYTIPTGLLENFNSTYLLGGASDIKLGLTMTASLLANRQQVDKTTNVPAIIIFGRGTYKDGANCCDPPEATAQAIRTQYGAQMKGVVVGRASSDAIMTGITGTSNIDIDPSIDYYNDGHPYLDGVHIAGQIEAWIESVRRSTSCPLPQQLPYCPIYMDIVIVWRYSRDNATFTAIQNFITKLLVAPGTRSTFAGAEQGTVNDRLTRIALVMYDSQNVTSVFNLTQYKYLADYANAIASLQWKYADVQPFHLSDAMGEAEEVLLNSARLYASRSVIVIADQFGQDDLSNSITEYHNLHDLVSARVFGLYIGSGQQDISEYQQFTDQRLALMNAAALDPTKATATTVANAIHDFVCAGVPPPPPPPPTTPPPCTNPPPTTSAPPTQPPAGAWPDITVLLDTSADLRNGAQALNDKGFEAVRMFLVNTFQQYNIDATHTRITLVTFDETPKVVFTFNQNLNKSSLMNAIGNQWEYGPAGSHTSSRNLNAALQKLLTDVFNENTPSGYNPNRVNYLWVLVTGFPSDGGSDQYAKTLSQIQAMGIRTQAIGLGSMDQAYLSKFGTDSFDYDMPFDPLYGIASANSPLPRWLFQQTTASSNPLPTLGQISADFVFVIEESTQLTQTHFEDVRGFLRQFCQHLQFGPTGSSVAMFSYNNQTLMGWTLNAGNNQQVVLNITDRLRYQNNNITTPNINAALDSLNAVYLNATTGYQNRSTFVIFLTSSQTVYPTADGFKADFVRQKANVFAIDIGGNNTAPEYFGILTNNNYDNQYAVSGPGALQNWINKPLINGTNPMYTFFRKISEYQQAYVANHDIPVNQLKADFIFAIDETLLTPAFFKSIQAYLVNLTAQFTIDPLYTQVGVMTYTGSTVPAGAFHLNSNGNYSQLVNAINNLNFYNNTNNTVTADIAKAYEFITNIMLQPAQGWRYGPTFVIVLSSAMNSTMYNGSFNVPDIQQLDAKAHTYCIDLYNYGSGSQGFLTHYCESTAALSSPNSLTINSDTSKAVVQKIDALYKSDRFPPLPPLSSVKMDFVFVIDESLQMTNSDFAEIITFLNNLVTQVGLDNIGINGSQFAVIGYDSLGNVSDPQSSFALNNYTNGPDLQYAIQHLRTANRSQRLDADITAAIQFVNNYTLTAAQGRRWRYPVIVTFIAIAQNVTNPLNQPQIDLLNANAQTFGFDYFNYLTTWQYLIQITGDRDHVERVSDFDVSKPGVQNYYAFVQTIWRNWANSNSRRRR